MMSKEIFIRIVKFIVLREGVFVVWFWWLFIEYVENF